MTPDQFTIRSFYWKAVDEYLGAVDQFTDLYDRGKTPARSEFTFADTRLRSAYDKVDYVQRTAKDKYGIELEDIPQFLAIGGTA